MISLSVRDGLPYVALTITFQGVSLVLQNVLLDTGSYSTILAADSVQSLGIRPEPEDKIRFVYGVGGTEPVVEKKIESIVLDEVTIPNVTIQLGASDYGIPIDAILGFDLLQTSGAVIDLDALTLKTRIQSKMHSPWTNRDSWCV